MSLHETWRHSITRCGAADQNQKDAGSNQVLAGTIHTSPKNLGGIDFNYPRPLQTKLTEASATKRCGRASPRRAGVRQARSSAANLDHGHTTRDGPRCRTVGKPRDPEVV